MAITNGGPLRAPDTTVVFTPSTITIAVGETATINYVSGMAAPSASTLDTLFGGIATTEVDGGGVVGTIVISGVSAGTVSIAPSTPLGNGATMSQDGFTLTVTAPVDDDKFLNKRGLTHFWENIDEIKQDKLTAGTNITIAADNTISASQPTVNNATLTIQKNGTTVNTFTANASSNVTANISVPTKTSDLTNDGSDNTAQYLETDETAYKTASIPYGQCDSTSTATVFTATVPGITELRDGVCMWLKNGVVTSAAGFTININNLGAKPVYNNMAAATADTTIFNANYTMLFVYDSTRVAGGCWVCYRGYNSDNNTIGYQIRTNSQSLPMTSVVYRYRLLFTSADNEHYVPANNSTSTNATASRTVCQDKINPFGRIFYYSSTASIAVNARPGATALWEQYAIALGYSFNSTGAALTLTSWKPVYLKCAPQSDGSAIIDSTTPYVQDLPTTEDGKIYIFLGVAYSATNIELQLDHPVYYYKDGMIRLWTADIAVPTKTSDLTNDGADGGSPYVTEADIAPAELGGEGSAIHIEGTTDCSAIDTAILGNIEQATYTGKNLLQAKMPTTTLNGITCTNNGDGSYTLNGTATAGADFRINQSTAHGDDNLQNYDGTYTLSCNELQSDMQLIVMQNQTWSQILRMRNSNTPATATFTKNDCFIYIYVAQGKTLNNLRVHPMLEKSATATAYEPYVGGTPAPNPSYPQPISTVTGRQTVTITGKNLIYIDPNFSYGITTTYNGTTGEINISGTSTNSTTGANGWANISKQTPISLPAGTYTLTRSISRTFRTALRLYHADGTYSTIMVQPNNTTRTETIAKDVVRYYAYCDSLPNTAINDTFTLQLEQGNSASSFEPYKAQEYEINLGKNLFDKNNVEILHAYNNASEAVANERAWSIILKCNPNTTYTYSNANSTTTMLNDSNIGFYATKPVGGTSLISRVIIGHNATSTFTTPATAEYMLIYYYWGGDQHESAYEQIQIEKGNQASSYSAYFEPIELCKIGTYQDKIYKSGGKWYLHKEVGKVVLNGSENWSLINAGSSNFYYNLPVFVTPKDQDIMPVSDYFVGTPITNGNTSVGLWITNAGTIRARKETEQTLADFKTWLGTALPSVYYVLATPTTTEITNETLIRQLEALAGALGYDGVTNIISTSPGLPAILSVSTYTGSAIPSATIARAGIVRIGDGIDVDDCGTISVNAQKAPTAFTMQYADNLGGWRAGDNYELVKETTGTPTDYIYRANKFYYGGTGVSFLNEKTGVVLTPQELYAWLLDGNEAVLNHVPLGWAVDNGAEVLYAGNYIDGIWLKREAIASQSGNMISFNGSAFVTALIPRTSSYEETVQDTLGIAISGYEDDGAMVYDLISIDGFSLYGSVQESSPII